MVRDPDSPGARPLAQDGTVVARVPDDTPDRYWYFICSGFVALADGTLLAAGSMPIVGPGVVGADGSRDCPIWVSRSRDRGNTWAVVCRIPFQRRMEVFLYARGTTAFMFVAPEGKGGQILAAASEDGGTTWSEPAVIIQRKAAWNAGGKTAGAEEGARRQSPGDAGEASKHWYCLNQTAVVERDGRLYLAASDCAETMAVAVCELAKGVLNPQAWQISDEVEMPIPRELSPDLFTGPAMRCLEGNVIEVAGRLRVLARACIDHYATSNLAAVFDLDDSGERPRLSFTQFYPVPGGQCKFFIVYDRVSHLFWMASNLPANSQGLVDSPANMPLGNDRRFLSLWYACDALNWFPAGCIARTERLTEAFMYPVMVIDGDDLALLVRTSVRYSGLQAEIRAKNGFHDANLLTFHRVRDFRSLAFSIHPRA